MPAVIITPAYLISLSACGGQVRIFRERWPKGCHLTRNNLLAAAALGLDLDWFALAYLDARALEAYELARARALADVIGLPNADPVEPSREGA